MVYGSDKWNDKSIRYDQENNIVESYLKKIRAAGDIDFSLESCNVEATACAVEAVGAEWKVYKEPWEGYGDRIFDFLNSPKNQVLLPAINPTTPSNEIMDNLAYTVGKFSNAHSKVHHYQESDRPEFPAEMFKFLHARSALVVSYLTDYNSGHYITVVAFDTVKNRFLCYDPWSKNRHCKNGGVLEEYKESFFSSRMRTRIMEVWK